jgi:hypothetical protein
METVRSLVKDDATLDDTVNQDVEMGTAGVAGVVR